MKKLKNIIEKISTQVKELMKNYSLTTILIIFVTLVASIMIDENFPDKVTEMIEKITAYCVIWGFGTYFTESYFSSKSKKLISYATTGVVSLAFTKCIFADVDNYQSLLIRVLSTYLIILFSLSVYKIIKDRKISFSKYLMSVFKDCVNNTIVYSILAIGISILTFIFMELILDSSYIGDVILRLETLLFGWYYVLSLLYSISILDEEHEGQFAKKLVLYVFLPLVIIAMAIIYMYIAKIIILKDIPKNIIFRILAGIFVVGFPVWNMASCYADEKKWIEKITSKLPYLYIPFFFLEAYSIGVRINEFGVTPARYFACAFIIFQVISLFLNIYKNKEKQELIFVIISVLIAIILVTPINYEKISNLSQKAIIEKYLKQNEAFENLENDKKEKVKGAYRYLTGQDAENYLPEYLTEDTITKIKEYEKDSYSYLDDYKYFYDSKELDLNIEPYVQIIEVSGRTDEGTSLELEEINQEIDLSDIVQTIIEKEKNHNAEKYFEDNNLVHIDKSHDLYIDSLNLEYSDNTVKYLSINGFWLTRKI